MRGLEKIVDGFPVGTRAFHGGHLALFIPKPLGECADFFACRAKCSYFLLLATSEAGDDRAFVHINPTTAFVRDIHEDSLPLYDVASSMMAHFTIRPFERSSEQSVVRKKEARSVYTARSNLKNYSTFNVCSYYTIDGGSRSLWCRKAWAFTFELALSTKLSLDKLI